MSLQVQRTFLTLSREQLHNQSLQGINNQHDVIFPVQLNRFFLGVLLRNEDSPHLPDMPTLCLR